MQGSFALRPSHRNGTLSQSDSSTIPETLPYVDTSPGQGVCQISRPD
jgi:hypothetical protein